VLVSSPVWLASYCAWAAARNVLFVIRSYVSIPGMNSKATGVARVLEYSQFMSFAKSYKRRQT
jgi:hypothetical protein